MSETTYISEELVMEGTLDSAGSSVVLAGRFKGEIRAKDVLLEANSIFDGCIVALLGMREYLDSRSSWCAVGKGRLWPSPD